MHFILCGQRNRCDIRADFTLNGFEQTWNYFVYASDHSPTYLSRETRSRLSKISSIFNIYVADLLGRRGHYRILYRGAKFVSQTCTLPSRILSCVSMTTVVVPLSAFLMFTFFFARSADSACRSCADNCLKHC